MRLVPKRWHTETWICSIRGHQTPAARVLRLRAEDRPLGIEVPGQGGDRLARCLRCDAWLEVPAPAPGTPGVTEVLPALADLAKPRRGRVLQDAVLLRLIAINKAIHAITFGLLAMALAVLRFKLPGLQASARDLDDQIRQNLAQTGQQASRDRIVDVLHRVVGLHRSVLTILLVTAVAYCVVEAIEAVGLWKEKRWAEYLTVVATAGLLPFEIHELIERITVFRVGALVVNVAILAWLVWAKHLFGVRGGAKTLDEHTDWPAILATPAPAPHR
ncbi:MAG: hypothetical protein JWO77_3155 [Ilumatobacteraceae bacterium]|nr:hypothetical protein [Ilumatobacteraceae bacterium]